METGHVLTEQAAAAQGMRADYKVNIHRALRSATEDKQDFAQSGIISLRYKKGPIFNLREAGHISLPLGEIHAGKFRVGATILHATEIK
jgi:hypothetical protein